MKRFRTKDNVVAVMILIMYCLNNNKNGSSWWCFGNEEEEGIVEILAPMEREEKEGLYRVIQGFVGNWWNGSDLYPDPCGWTPIQGVSCDLYNGLWYITDLNIGPVHENSLVCSNSKANNLFTPNLFDLKHLKSLSFFNCFTSNPKHHRRVSIPSQGWERLAALESLEFRSNSGLTGPIPDSLGSLAKLRSLVISENGLEGQLPESIGELTGLERLVISGNTNLTGKIPDGIFAGLNKLLIVDLSRNSLAGESPTSLRNLSSLLKLDLSENRFEGNLPRSDVLSAMKRLTLLDLSGNRFSGGLRIRVGFPSQLEQVVLSNNPIGGDLGDVDWESLGKLSILDLSKTGLSGEIPDSVMGLNGLRFLGLSENNLSGGLSTKLEGLPALGALYIYGNNLTGELGFSGFFYRKMGRRFGAWGNPNLCYRHVSVPSHVPFGVRPCHHHPKRKVKLVEPKSLNSNFVIASSSSGNFGIDAFWYYCLVSLSLELLFMYY